jgi:uncharacterized protein (DUF1697 family)
MGTFIALLRGVNVGGRGKVAMAELKAMLAEIGFDAPQSLLQSGNLVFGARGGKAEALEKRLHAEITERFAINTELFVRTPDEWRDLVAQNPLKSQAKTDPARLHAWVMKQAPDRAAVEALRAANAKVGGPEIIEARDRVLYIHFPDGAGASKLSGLIDRHMPTRGTGRNWNTVLKLLAMVEGV